MWAPSFVASAGSMPGWMKRAGNRHFYRVLKRDRAALSLLYRLLSPRTAVRAPLSSPLSEVSKLGRSAISAAPAFFLVSGLVIPWPEPDKPNHDKPSGDTRPLACARGVRRSRRSTGPARPPRSSAADRSSPFHEVSKLGRSAISAAPAFFLAGRSVTAWPKPALVTPGGRCALVAAPPAFSFCRA